MGRGHASPERDRLRHDLCHGRLRLRNRAGRAMRIVEPADKPSPPSPPSQDPCVAGRVSSARIASGQSYARRKGAGDVCLFSTEAPAPFRQASLEPLPCFLRTRAPPCAFGPARAAPGAMTCQPAHAPFPFKQNRPQAAGASLSFVGRWRGRLVLGLTRYDGFLSRNQ
jgi:hypothetical protein